MVVPIAYVTLVRKIGFRKVFLPATMGTLLGGFVGAFGGTPGAILAGIAGVFLAFKWTVDKASRSEQP